MKGSNDNNKPFKPHSNVDENRENECEYNSMAPRFFNALLLACTVRRACAECHDGQYLDCRAALVRALFGTNKLPDLGIG